MRTEREERRAREEEAREAREERAAQAEAEDSPGGGELAVDGRTGRAEGEALCLEPARARALARLARPAARGPAPRSRTAPGRERCRGAAAAHTLVVVAPVAAHVVISHRRHAATPRVAAAAATPPRVAIVTAHVIVAHPNLAVVSRRAAYASPRASNLTRAPAQVVVPQATSVLGTY